MSTIQIKSGSKGSQIRGMDGRSFWLSPARDILYNFDPFCHRAFAYLENTSNPVVKEYYANGGSNEELCNLAVAVKRFVSACGESKTGDTAKTAMDKAELLTFPPRALAVYGYALMMVNFSAFHHQLFNSQNGEIDVESLMGFAEIEHKGASLWKRLKSFFRPTSVQVYRSLQTTSEGDSTASSPSSCALKISSPEATSPSTPMSL